VATGWGIRVKSRTMRRLRITNALSLLAAATLVAGGLAGCNKSKETPPMAPNEPQKAPPAPAQPAGPPPDPNAPADVKAAPADADKTPSGLASKVLKPGTGKDKPSARDTVNAHYTGWTTDGRKFDSSVDRGQPLKFPLDRVIKGWTEGLQLMVVGEKRRFWIPSELAYGPNAAAMGRPAGMLVFDVELLGFDKAPEPPKVPEDVAAVPKNAKKTKSGLAYRVLKAGKGKKPKATSVVVVNYSGWTLDGKMFDSSVTTGQPAEFPLNQVIPGWTEGVQLMAQGEKTRFWIPAALAYGEKPAQPGAPAGMLVFDIELLEVKN
jgi:peptidylprolyl isomerase